MRLVSHAMAFGLNLSLAEKPALAENGDMQIECPSCSAAFEVPERLLRDRTRPLRCSQCRTVFPMPAPPEPDPELFPGNDPAPSPPPLVDESHSAPSPSLATQEAGPAPAASTEPPPSEAANEASTRGLRAAWAASIALLIGGVLAAIIKREALMEAWPPVARLFAALGLM